MRGQLANLVGWGAIQRFSDSDYFFWDELAPSQLEIIGDGIPDGWEAQYGLDPLNASDATIDSDLMDGTLTEMDLLHRM